MNYIYFELDKNSKQFKTLTIGEYTIDLRIEWNVRSKSWFILGYVGEELVLTNTKFEANRLYSFDKNISQNLPYNISVLPKFPDNDWDTPTAVVITDDFYANSRFGLSEKNIFIDRNITTSAFTHSKTSVGSTRNSYLFELEDTGGGDEIIIICDDASHIMKTIGLPTGQWDFKINNTDYRLAIQDDNYSELITLFAGYGIEVSENDDGYYDWINTSDDNVKIYGLYPFESGYEFLINESSNNSLKIINTDENNWVNEFSVCLTKYDNPVFSEPYDLTVEFKND